MSKFSKKNAKCCSLGEKVKLLPIPGLYWPNDQKLLGTCADIFFAKCLFERWTHPIIAHCCQSYVLYQAIRSHSHNSLFCKTLLPCNFAKNETNFKPTPI